MKTAISLPDALFEEVERIAEAAGKTRSEVYREALTEYVARRDVQSVTRAFNEAVEGIDQTPDEWLVEARRQALQRVEW